MVPVSLVDFLLSLAERILADFHSQMSCCHLFQALVMGSPIGVETPHFSGENFAAEISLHNISHCPESSPALFTTLPSQPASIWLLL